MGQFSEIDIEMKHLRDQLKSVTAENIQLTSILTEIMTYARTFTDAICNVQSAKREEENEKQKTI